MIPSLEVLFTDERYWGVTTATPVQRAFCRVIEGRPLGELADHPDVRWAVGGEDALEMLAPGGPPPRHVSIYGAVRIGKSDLASCLAFRAAMTVDMRGVRAHEVPRIPILSLSKDLGDVTLGHLLGRLQKPQLAPLVIERGAEHVLLRHPSGRAVEVRVAAGARAGGTLIARWNTGAIFDEKPRMVGSGDGVINYDDALSAVEGRLLPGAQVIDLGSPWAPFGPAYDDVQAYWGRPTKHRVVLRITGPMGNPGWWTPKRCDELREKSPLAYKTDVLGEFADGELAVLPSDAVQEACARSSERYAWHGRRSIYLDPSALRRDTFVVCVGGWSGPLATDDEPYFYFPVGTPRCDLPPGTRLSTACIPRGNGLWAQLLDERGNPIQKPQPKPVFVFDEFVSWDGGSAATVDDIVGTIVHLARKYDARDVHSDQFEAFSLGGLLGKVGLRFLPHPWTSASSGPSSKTAAVDHLRRLLIDRQIAFPDHRRLRDELMRFHAKPTPTGFSYVVSGGQGHGDHASAVLMAMRAELEGYVDASPHGRSRAKYEVYDYVETE